MTINEVIAKTKTLKPHPYADTILIGWLSELDGQLHDTLFAHRADAPALNAPYDAQTDGNTELLVPYPYTEIYTYWLAAKIDYANQEYDRYSNGMAMYNTYLNSFAASWARSHADGCGRQITAI